MPVLATDILTRLLAHPTLAQTLQFTQVQRFLEFTRRIWPEIVSKTGAVPTVLPPHTAAFLSSVLSLSPELITLSWLAFGDMAATFYNDPIAVSLDDAFRLHSNDHHIGAEPLKPPIRSCVHPECCNATLKEPRVVEARLYTLNRGVLPVFSTSLYCRSCRTRYYPNYFVQGEEAVPGPDDPGQAYYREYYDSSVPEFIHVTTSSYVESKLCTYIEMQMAMTHSSAESIAHVYNLALGISEIPNASRLSHQLDGELVLDAFFYHAVLRDKSTRKEILRLPHHGSQRHRLDNVLKERNFRMIGTGQEMWAHTCDRCMKVYQGEDGHWYQITAGVHDGVTVRCLVCSIHDCTEPLPSQKARFCKTHSALNNICYINGCQAPIELGFNTCSLEPHRAHELASWDKHAAMFQLKNRLQTHGIPEVPPAGSPPVPSSSSPASSSVLAQAPPSTLTPNPAVKGKNSRSWSHNEQLFVRCCGVIISRATFYGSEGLTGVSAFLKATFPPKYPGAMPSYIFYDNNCSFKKHLLASGDHYFDRVGLPVDVWHFKCKHKEQDVFCQVHCNPARFRELIGEKNTWIFNSSAAEQSNAWFGKFQNTVQEMPVLRYNFFLDEMIAIHNRHVVTELARTGERPHMLLEEVLRSTFIPSSSV
ncbi:hypothetical protein B0H19DRAFT_1143016 [Mycena capillaripes]|nr:hypothetical protein B0H19DRAFT_1143016 [Mycena capillaripes]